MDLFEDSDSSDAVQSLQSQTAGDANKPETLSKHPDPPIFPQTVAASNMLIIKEHFNKISKLFMSLSPSLNIDGRQEILKELSSFEQSFRNNLDLFKESSAKMLKYQQSNLTYFKKKQIKYKYNKWVHIFNANLNEMKLVLVDYKKSMEDPVNSESIASPTISNSSISIGAEDPSLENKEATKDKYSKVEELLSPLSSNTSWEYCEKEDIVKEKIKLVKSTPKKQNLNQNVPDQDSPHSQSYSPPDVSSYLHCSLLLKESPHTPKTLQETLLKDHSTSSEHKISPEQIPDVAEAQIPQDGPFKIFDLEELKACDGNGNTSPSPHKIIESDKNVVLSQSEKDSFQSNDKILMDLIASVMQDTSSSTSQHDANYNNFPSHFMSGQGTGNNLRLEVDTILSPSVQRNYIVCLICNDLFENQELLRHHMNLLHTPKVCSICCFTTIGWTNYENHVDKEHSLYKLCQLCDTIVEQELFAAHFEAHTRKELKCFKCSICFKAFNSKDELSKHEKTHDDILYQCLHCEKVSLTRFEEKKHSAGHLAPRLQNNLCKICHAHFDTEGRLLAHMRSRHLMKANVFPTKMACLICHAEFDDSQSLITHVKNYHRKSNIVERSNKDERTGMPKHKCPHCTVHIKNPKILAIHCIVSHEVAPFVCDCKEAFFTKGLLDVHVLKHSKPDEIKFQLDKRGRKRKLSECDSE